MIFSDFLFNHFTCNIIIFIFKWLSFFFKLYYPFFEICFLIIIKCVNTITFVVIFIIYKNTDFAELPFFLIVSLITIGSSMGGEWLHSISLFKTISCPSYKFLFFSYFSSFTCCFLFNSEVFYLFFLLFTDQLAIYYWSKADN